MIIVLHEVSPGQSRRCIESLLDEAKALARTRRMQATRSLGEVVHWIREQPYLREGDQEPVYGLGVRDHCRPHQRIRFWPEGGINCWEASCHYAGAVLRHGLPRGYRLHLWDVRADKDELIGEGVVLHAGARHAFPRLEGPDGKQQLVNLQSQHPHGVLRPVAANDIWSDIALGTSIATPVLAMVAGAEGGPVAGQAVGALGQIGTAELLAQSSDGKQPAKPATKAPTKPVTVTVTSTGNADKPLSVKVTRKKPTKSVRRRTDDDDDTDDNGGDEDSSSETQTEDDES